MQRKWNLLQPVDIGSRGGLIQTREINSRATLGGWPKSTRQRAYIVLSHMLGRGLERGHIAHRVWLEQAVGAVLGLGLFSPFHIKKIKKIIQQERFGTEALPFLRTLRLHVAELLEGRWVVLVVDDLSGLPSEDTDEAAAEINTLCAEGVKVLIKRPGGVLLPMNEVPDRMKALQREIAELCQTNKDAMSESQLRRA